MPEKELSTREFVWALGSCCALHGKPFDAQLALRQFDPPYLGATQTKAVRELCFHANEELTKRKSEARELRETAFTDAIARVQNASRT